jgi:hypothetical protein
MMETTKPEIQPAHSLTTPAVPLTLIVTYYKWLNQGNPDTLEVVSATMPVVALRDEEGQTHAVVLADGDLSIAYKAAHQAPLDKGYGKGWRRLCLTSEVEQRSAELEADFRAMMLIRTREDVRAAKALKESRGMGR